MRKTSYVPVSTSWTILAFVLTLLISRSGPLWAAESLAGTQGEGPPSVSKDDRVFDPHGATYEERSPGRLAHGGYCVVGAQLQTRYFRLSRDPRPMIRVEVAIHPTDYDYAIHDLFGTFLEIEAHDRLRRGGRPVGTQPAAPGGDDSVIQFIEWPVEGASMPAVLCGHRNERDEGEERFLGWYHVDGKQVTTVLVIYEHLNGLPAKVIDEYLARYPSSMVKNDVAAQNWTQRDLGKWADVLKTRRADPIAVGEARRNLVLRFKRDFGLRDADAQRSKGDPQVYNQAMDEVVRQVEALARERAAAASQPAASPD